MTLPLAGGPARPIASGNPNSLQSSGTSLYWMDGGGEAWESIRSLSIPTGTVRTVLPQRRELWGLTVSADHVYWMLQIDPSTVTPPP